MMIIVAAILAIATILLVTIITILLVTLAMKINAEVDVPQRPIGQVIANETHLPENCDESSDDANCAAFQIKVNKS